MTLEFETGLNKRFFTLSGVDANIGGGVGELTDLPKEHRVFDGKVSVAFEPYLKLYVDAEDRNIADMNERFR